MDCSMPGSLSITNSRSLLRLMSIESVMPCNHFILCCPLLFLPSIFPSIRVFSNESVLHIRWPKYWSFSFNINPDIYIYIYIYIYRYISDILKYMLLCNHKWLKGKEHDCDVIKRNCHILEWDIMEKSSTEPCLYTNIINWFYIHNLG